MNGLDQAVYIVAGAKLLRQMTNELTADFAKAPPIEPGEIKIAKDRIHLWTEVTAGLEIVADGHKPNARQRLAMYDDFKRMRDQLAELDAWVERMTE